MLFTGAKRACQLCPGSRRLKHSPTLGEDVHGIFQGASRDLVLVVGGSDKTIGQTAGGHDGTGIHGIGSYAQRLERGGSLVTEAEGELGTQDDLEPCQALDSVTRRNPPQKTFG
jgi:hypothetical protein